MKRKQPHLFAPLFSFVFLLNTHTLTFYSTTKSLSITKKEVPSITLRELWTPFSQVNSQDFFKPPFFFLSRVSSMDEFYFERSHVPAFGSWQCHGVQEFTQCFESARQAGQLRCRYSEDHDLYVIGDLYDNDILTPAKIIVPRSREARVKTGNPKEREGKKDAQVECDYDCEVERVGWAATKAVDEDLYKISPHLLRQNPKRGEEDGLSFQAACGPHVFSERTW
ncbi:hypothetical protein OROHE_016842 [Orobanche hederae]